MRSGIIVTIPGSITVTIAAENKIFLPRNFILDSANAHTNDDTVTPMTLKAII